MKILLCCKAGVTSNMFASALKDEASKKDMEVIIWATAETMIEYSIEQADLILVTPQLKSSVSKFEDLAKAGTPVILISDEDFVQFNAKKVLEDQDLSQAAVCSAYAAKVYGLSVLEENINDEPNNSTRFIIITNQKIFTAEASKISLCFEVPHTSGSLYHILSHFIYNNVNMSKIESRPVEGKSWEYRFFVDIEGNLADPAVKNALRGLREEAMNLKILGNY